jgi:hypothetical protein
MFDPASRYAGIEVARVSDGDGRATAYVRRRFAPPGSSLPLLVEVTVAQDDRLDLITARTLGDPEHFWRVCDANDAMNPVDLTGGDAVGRALRVPVPQP